MKLPLNTIVVRDLLKSKGLTYRDIEVRLGGLIREYDLKNVLNGVTKGIPEEKARILARHLDVPLERIVNPEYLRNASGPPGVIMMTERLFVRKFNQIHPFYKEFFNERSASPEFKALLRQASVLYLDLTKPALEGDREGACLTVAQRILADFGPKGKHSCRLVMGDQSNLEWFLSELQLVANEYVPHISVMIFLYTLSVVESILVEVMVASALQASIDRSSPVVNQYQDIALEFQNVKGAYVESLFTDGAKFDAPLFAESGLDSTFVDDAILLASVGHRCVRHFGDDFAASEQVNRSVLDAIVTRLRRTATEMGIHVASPSLVGRTSSRFAILMDRFRDRRSRHRQEELEASKQADHVRTLEKMELIAKNKRLENEQRFAAHLQMWQLKQIMGTGK